MQGPEKVFGTAIGVNFQSISSTFANSMAPFALDPMTQTVSITFPTGIQTPHSSQRNSPDPYISHPQTDQLRNCYLLQFLTRNNNESIE